MDPSNEKFCKENCCQLEGSSNTDGGCWKEQGCVKAVDSPEEPMRSGSPAAMSKKIPAITTYRLSPEEVLQKYGEAALEGQKKSKKYRRYRVHPQSRDGSSSDSSQSDPEENLNESGKCSTDESNFKLREPKLKLGLTSTFPTADHPQGTSGPFGEVSPTTVDFEASGEVKMDITSAEEGSDGCVVKEGLANAESLDSQAKLVSHPLEISPEVSQSGIAAMEVDAIQTDEGTDGSQRCEKPLRLRGTDSSHPANVVGHNSSKASLHNDFTDLHSSEYSHVTGVDTNKAEMSSETDSGSCVTETSSVPVKTESKEDIESPESLKDTTVNVTTAKKLDERTSRRIGFRARYAALKKEEISKASSNAEKIHQTLAVVSPERASHVQDVSSNKITHERLPAMTACLTTREMGKYSSNHLLSLSVEEHIPMIKYSGITSSSIGDRFTNEDALCTVWTVPLRNRAGSAIVGSQNVPGYTNNQQENHLWGYFPHSYSGPASSPQNCSSDAHLGLRRMQNGENTPQNDHVQILKPSSKNSVALEDQLFTDILAKKLQQLSVQQFLQQVSFDKFCSQFEETPATSTRPCFRIFVKMFYEKLHLQAARLENLFKAYICVPDGLLGVHLKPLQESKNVSEQVPTQIRECLFGLVDSLVQEYKERNSIIQKHELGLMEALLHKAVVYYTEEMNYIIQTQPGYLVDDTFERYQEEVLKETEVIFLQAAGLKHERWTAQYRTDLRNQLELERKTLEKHRQAKAQELELMLKQIMEDAVEKYKKMLDKEKQIRDFNPKASNAVVGLHLIGSAANQAASQYFQRQCAPKNLETIDPQVTQRIKYYRQKMEEEMDSLFALQLTIIEDLQQEFQEQIHLSGASTAIARAEPQYLSFLNIRALSVWLLFILAAGIYGGLSPLANEKNPEGPMESAVVGSYSVDSYSVNISNSKKPDLLVKTQGHKRSRPPSKLPQCEFAIHFGLHRTLTGIVTPGTEDFLILYDIDDRLYFDHPDLLLCLEVPECQKYKPSRIPNILETPPNLPREVIIENTKSFMRLEELIACLFYTLKWKTELDQMVAISNSVICTPQCLNQAPRKTGHEASRVPDFRNVTLIDDTSAVELGLMLNNEIVKSNLIVANTSKGFVDATYFNFDNGIVHGLGVSGEYFTKKKGDRNIAYKYLYFLGHFGIEYYSEFRENIFQIFNGYGNESGSPCPRRQSHLNSLILSGNQSQFVYQRRRVLDFDSHLACREVPHVVEDHKTALFGAAHLTVLNYFKPEHPICKRRVSLTKLEPSEDLQIFRKYLLDHTPVQGVSTKTNPTPGNFSNADFNRPKETFYLNERRQQHRMKMQEDERRCCTWNPLREVFPCG